jgi:hypothetical protein
VAERKRGRLPRFKSREEEAKFWDTHSLADFADELEPAAVKADRPLGQILGIRLDAETVDRLACIGRAKGIGPSTLARIWIMERLAEVDGERPSEYRPEKPSRQ